MIKKQFAISRRSLLKGAVAFAAAGTAGCSKFSTASVAPALEPLVDEKVFIGNSAHNCGGSCITKAHVKNGQIVRFTTDENHDSEVNPQLRACVKCRSYKGRLYHPGRILYPLLQTGERGDLNTFKRISWDEALDYLCKKYNTLIDKYGPECVFYQYGWGAFHPMSAFPISKLLAHKGHIRYLGTYSSHQVSYLGSMVCGSRNSFTMSPETWQHAKTILLWGAQFAETINGTNNPYFQALAKKKGAYTYFIGPYHSTTCQLADEWVPIKQGTDTSLMLAMIHEMIVNGWLDEDSLQNFSMGFYDDPEGNKLEIVDGTKEYLKVPAGMSLSAYIMGDNDLLVKKGKNKATCKYPHNAKSKFIYKQYANTEKTPEWAEKITGVPAAKIREIAKAYSNNTPSLINASLGLQRQMEGVNNMWLLVALTMASGQWGRLGSGFMCKYGIYGSPIMSKNLFENTFPPNPVNLEMECNLWADAARSESGKRKSEFGDGNVNSMKVPIKVFFCMSSNIIDTHMNSVRSMELFKDKSNMELIAVTENFMTNTAKYADLILPGDMTWERHDITFDAKVWSFVAGNHMIFLDKAIEAPGEAKSHFWMAEKIADKMGWKNDKGQNLVSEGKTDLEWIKWIYEGTGEKLSFDEFRKQGYIANPYDKHYIGSQKLRESGRCTKELNFFSRQGGRRRGTQTGYVELYSKYLREEYETRGVGQNNKDSEGDPIVYEIPMCFDFMDAYVDTIFKNKPDARKEYPLQVISSHFMYRSHSTHNNNPYLREIYKRDAKGNSVYDANTYAADPMQEQYAKEDALEAFWMNDEDAAKMGIKHGQRVKVTSAMTGKSMYLSAYVTPRMMPGCSQVYHGSWTDLDALGIDHGGCSNVLFSEQPSRIDHGPAQMTALVKVEKV